MWGVLHSEYLNCFSPLFSFGEQRRNFRFKCGVLPVAYGFFSLLPEKIDVSTTKAEKSFKKSSKKEKPSARHVFCLVGGSGLKKSRKYAIMFMVYCVLFSDIHTKGG